MKRRQAAVGQRRRTAFGADATWAPHKGSILKGKNVTGKISNLYHLLVKNVFKDELQFAYVIFCAQDASLICIDDQIQNHSLQSRRMCKRPSVETASNL